MVEMKLINEKNLAKQLDVSVAKLRRDRFEKRGLPFIKIRKTVRYDMGQVERFLKDNTVNHG
jgi:hypothetical protein